MGGGSAGSAGWYHQQDGSYRYWDGSSWTLTDAEYRRQHSTGGAPSRAPKSGLPAWGWIAIALGGVVFVCGGLGLIGAIGEPANIPTAASESVSPTAASSTAAPPASATPLKPSPTLASTRAPAPPAVTTAPPAPPTPPAPPAPPASAAPAAAAAVAVTRVVDGDTIETTVGTIRLIGIDTPESGECNYEPATVELENALAAHGNQVVLVAGATDDTDKYGRLLRYVDTVEGEDLNLHMITTGLAIARYDSRDGYGRHPREAAYVSADAANTAPTCQVPATTQPPAPLPTVPPPAQAPVPVAPQDTLDPRFPTCKAATSNGFGNYVSGVNPEYDWYRDADGDGIVCEF